MIMLSKETGFINLRQSLLLTAAAGMNMNGVYKLCDNAIDGFAFWLRIGGQQRQSHGLSLFPYYPTNSTLLPNWIVASISTMKIGQMTLQGSFHIHVCKCIL